MIFVFLTNQPALVDSHTFVCDKLWFVYKISWLLLKIGKHSTQNDVPVGLKPPPPIHMNMYLYICRHVLIKMHTCISPITYYLLYIYTLPNAFLSTANWLHLIALDAHTLSHHGYGPGTKDRGPRSRGPGLRNPAPSALGLGPGALVRSPYPLWLNVRAWKAINKQSMAIYDK